MVPREDSKTESLFPRLQDTFQRRNLVVSSCFKSWIAPLEHYNYLFMLPLTIPWPVVYPWIGTQFNFPCYLDAGFLSYCNFQTVIIPPIEDHSMKETQQEPLEEIKKPNGRCSAFNPNKELIPKRNQNPYRNILTNITNLILNFILCRKKVRELLHSVDPALSEAEEQEFYEYIKYLKKLFCSYYNPSKLRNLFQGRQIPKYNARFHKLFRVICKVVLEKRIPLCLMTSKKISQQLREEHFYARRIIFNILRYGNSPNENRYSVGV